jgi:hypothetical protein
MQYIHTLVFIVGVLFILHVDGAKDADAVTCGSVIKLVHKETVHMKLNNTLFASVSYIFSCGDFPFIFRVIICILMVSPGGQEAANNL